MQEAIVTIWIFIRSLSLLLQLFLKAGQHSGHETTLLIPGLYSLVASHSLSSAGLGLLLEQEASEHLPRWGGSAQPHVDSKGNKFWMPCKGLWTWRSALFNQLLQCFAVLAQKYFRSAQMASSHVLMWMLLTYGLNFWSCYFVTFFVSLYSRGFLGHKLVLNPLMH